MDTARFHAEVAMAGVKRVAEKIGRLGSARAKDSVRIAVDSKKTNFFPALAARVMSEK
jgi:hypothetical protein